MSVLAQWLNVVKLGRLHMTQFSAITYLASAIVSCESIHESVKLVPFLKGYVFVFSCQMVAHFLGEYYDQDSDRLNIHGSRLTGGSGALKTNGINLGTALYIGWGFTATSLIWAIWVLPSNAVVMAFPMLFIAHQYSAPLLKLNHKGLGELMAAVVQNILLPAFAAACQSANFKSLFDERLQHLIWPAALIKFALFIVLNLNDRRPDWLSDKTTLPLQIGEDRAIILHSVLMTSAYVVSWNIMPFLLMKMLILASSPLAFYIVLQLWISRPYRYDCILALSLLHCTLVIWAILGDCMLRRFLRTGSLDWTLFPVAIMVFTFVRSCHAFLTLGSKMPSSHSGRPRLPILICGGGVAGLVSAIVCHRLKISYVLLEQRDEEDSFDGADLALWPSAVQIIRTLGITDKFFEENTRCVNSVLMQQMESKKTIHFVDMKAVVEGTNERFRLVSRRHLMTELKKLLPSQDILYKTKLIGIKDVHACSHTGAIIESFDDEVKRTKIIATRLIIGADGIYSTVRRLTLPHCGISVRYCGEMCYRGVINFNQTEHGSASFSLPAFKTFFSHVCEDTMLISYGRGVRTSVGLLSNSMHPHGYWWIKQASKEKEDQPNTANWPADLKTLYNLTPKDSLYVHEILDSKAASSRIASQYSVLIGDAAHPVTPNMGQGACMAIEDAFILCTNVGFFSNYVDGDTEACYQYEVSRKGHTSAIVRSSNLQSKIGQLSNPILVWIRDNILYKLPKKILINKLRANNFDISHHFELYRDQMLLAEG